MKAVLPKIGTPREREILEYAAQGLTDKEIAARLGISRETVATYWKRIRLRLDGASRTEAVARALTMEKDREVETLVSQNLALEEEVAARKEAEKQLQVVLRRLRVLVGCVNSGILLEDSSRRIILANPAFCTALGMPVTSEELIGLDCKQAAEDAAHLFIDSDTFVARVEQIVRGRRAVAGDLLRMKDGRCIQRDYVPVEIDGEQIGHLWQFREVTVSELDSDGGQGAAGFSTACAQCCSDLGLSDPRMVDQTIDQVLEKIGEASGTDRAYLFLFDLTRGTLTNTHEWSAPGITREKDSLQNLPMSTLPWCCDQLRSGKAINVKRMRDFQSIAPAEVRTWREQGIRSLFAVPVWHSGEVVGFVGLDSVRRERSWPTTFAESMEAVGRMIGRTLCLAERV